MAVTYTPLGKRLIASLIPSPDQTAVGIIKVEVGDDSPRMVRVETVGDEVRRVNVGDLVYTGRYTGQNLPDGRIHLIEEECLCIVHAETWRVVVTDDAGAVLAEFEDAPTALRRLDAEAGYLITPAEIGDAARKAIHQNEYVRVSATSPSGENIYLAKVATAGMFKTADQFVARGIKDAEGRFGLLTLPAKQSA